MKKLSKDRPVSFDGMSKRESKDHEMWYCAPQTKLRNLTCVLCNRYFEIRGTRLNEACLPLLLECGHSTCQKCSKQKKPCPICNLQLVSEGSRDSPVPINAFILGLTVVMQNYPELDSDADLAFEPSIESKLRHLQIQQPCSECGVHAILQCKQCNVYFCSPCFSKIHRRALQNHKKILLPSTNDNDSLIIRNTCSSECHEPLQYYCRQCDMSGCSHCMIRLHPKHDFITQREKNEELLFEFQHAYQYIAENLQRVIQAQKKLKKASVLPSEWENSDAVEASINRHFAYLHGVLQNLEKRVLLKLHEQRDYLSWNLEGVTMKLRQQEEQLQAGLLAAASVAESLDRVDLKEVMDQLQQLVDFPCHLVQDMEPEEKRVEFEVDPSIIETIERHCSLRVPEPVGYTLMQTICLPENYPVEPLPEDTYIKNLLERSLVPALKSASSTQSVDSYRPDNAVLAEGSSNFVKLYYIESPSCFFVQLVASLDQFKLLDKDIQRYVKREGWVMPDITLNKLYLFQHNGKKWCRGRVQKIETDSEGDLAWCSMFCIDYGNEEDQVPINRIRNIPLQFITMPPFAKKCCIDDIVPKHGKWEKEAIQYMINMKKKTVDDTILMHVKKGYTDMLSVDLCIHSSRNGDQLYSVRDCLVYLGHGSFASQHKLMRTNPQSVPRFYREELELDTFVDVTCQHVESPDLIYVRKTSENLYFGKVMEEMTKDYRSNLASKAKILVPEIGFPCAAPDSSGKWRRALIVGIPAEEMVEVLYVDLGCTSILKCNTIRRIPEYYMRCRTQAIKISMKNVKPISDTGCWGEDSIKFVRTYLMAGPFKVIASRKHEDSYPVYLYVYKDINFNNLLVSNGLAYSTASAQNTTRKRKNKRKANKLDRSQICSLPVKVDINTADKGLNNLNATLKEREIEQKSSDPFKIRVRIHRVESPDCVYVSDPTYEKINTRLTKQLQTFYTKYHSDQVDKWNKGVVCVVYSALYKCYCRARIVDIVSIEETVVYLYDLGITETVAITDVQPMHSTFVETPAYLFEIKLDGILPCGGSKQWPKSSCQKLAEIIDENQNCEYYISKMIATSEVVKDDEADEEEEQEDVGNKAVPVELWVKQSMTDGPLMPTRVETNSVNRMLLDAGLALPDKQYAEKEEKVLAIELQRHLEKTQTPVMSYPDRVKWILTCDKLSSTSADTSFASIPQTLANETEYDFENDVKDDIPLPSIMTTWIPAAPITEVQFVAVGSYLDNDCKLYVHPKLDSYNMLSYIESKLTDFYEKTKIRACDLEWAEGDPCVAQYHVNNKWYRGVVQKVHENYIQVKFVDYGNVEDCELGTIKKKVLFGHIPIQCVVCVIRGLEPDTADGKWQTEDLDKIHALLVDQEFTVTVYVHTTTHLVVKIHLHNSEGQELVAYLRDVLALDINAEDSSDHLLTDTDYSQENVERCMPTGVEDIPNSIFDLPDEAISDEDDLISGSPTIVKMKKLGREDIDENSLSKFDNSTWADLGNVDEAAIVTSTPQNASCEHPHSEYTPLEIPESVSIVDLELCCLVDITTYHAQLKENAENPVLHTYYKQYRELMQDMQENANKQPKVVNITTRSCCCTQFNDGLWYRCIILECVVINNDEVEILLQFVDFGNEETRTINLNNHDLYTLKEEWLNIPSMAIKCKLWNVEVMPKIDLAVIAPKLEKLHNKTVTARIIDRKKDYFEVELFHDKECKIFLYEFLIEEGFFIMKKPKKD